MGAEPAYFVGTFGRVYGFPMCPRIHFIHQFSFREPVGGGRSELRLGGCRDLTLESTPECTLESHG